MSINHPIIRLMLIFFGFFACIEAHALELSRTSLELVAGSAGQITVTGTSGTVSVRSRDTSIATVTYSQGIVTVKGVKAGYTKVTVTDRRSYKTADIKVVAGSAMTITPTSLAINVGGMANITVSNPSGAVSAMSSDTSVATVSYTNGVAAVKGIKVGTATVSIKDSITTKMASVTVSAIPAPTLTVSPMVVSLNVGSSTNISVANASGAVSVQSTDPATATATYSNGIAVVTGIKAGSTTVIIRDSTTSATIVVTVLNTTAIGSYTLLAGNDLGMHCMDGLDFSVFAILPPYNTLHAQLKDKNGKLVTSNVLVTYEAVADTSGSINTGSTQKTNFWDWAFELFGLSPAPNVGLNLDNLASGTPSPGNKAPSLTPAPMTYNPIYNWYEAEGIPVTPYDDKGNLNFYPTVKVVAKEASTGKVLASTTTVLPVSDEMTCKACHSSTDSTNPAQIAAKPAAGWVFDSNPDKDWKRNILKLHDQKQASNQVFKSALIQAKYPNGLLASADSGRPVLCAACHASNAYFDKENKTTVMVGLPGIRPFTQALHLQHANVLDPGTQIPLDNINNRSACYLCHPGSLTQCLRGAMGKAVNAKGEPLMSCQSCHGNLTAVANPARQGWYNEPTCESCHNSAAPGRRATSALDAQGIPIVPADHTFATNADTPIPGLNLYRFSKGHGGLQCEACHGPTHAEFPSSHAEENLQSLSIQGHTGPIAECSACHETVPSTVNGGPHGMHTTGDSWVKMHQGANKNGTATTPSCAYCHGTTSAGTPLSAVKVAKTINAGEFGTKNWPAGYQVSCYSCHNGPNP